MQSGPLCGVELCPHPWSWPWIFKVKFLKCCISGMGGLNWNGRDMSWKDVGPTMWPLAMTLKGILVDRMLGHYVMTLCLDLGLSRSNFEKAVSREWEDQLIPNKRDVSQKDVGPIIWPWAMTFKVILVDRMSGHHVTSSSDLGLSRSSFEKAVSQE